MQAKSANILIIAIVVISAFTAGIWLGIVPQNRSVVPVIQDTVITVLPRAKVLEPFLLQTGTGKNFDLDSLKGKYSLLFFGYTSCPDVCPTTMYQLEKLYSILEKDRHQQNFQVVFVSVDPRRDTPDRLEKYVTAFNRNFIGATGQKKQISNLARQLGASYDVEDDGKSKNYGVSHTDVIFIVDPDARFAAILTPPHRASRIESRLRLLMQVEQQKSN